MARGFSSYGRGTTDILSVPSTQSRLQHPQRSFFCRFFKAAAGSVGGIGRLFDMGGNLGFSETSVTSSASTTNGQWNYPASTFPANAWSTVALVYDASIGNAPRVWVNGAEVTFTSSTAPVGTIFQNGSVSFGNRTVDYDRCWNGTLAEIGFWAGTILTDQEVAQLSAGVPPPLARRSGLFLYASLNGPALKPEIGPALALIGPAGSGTGTEPVARPHPLARPSLRRMPWLGSLTDLQARTFLVDSFTEATNTDLTAHVPEVGGSYQRMFGSPNPMEVIASEGRAHATTAASDAMYLNNAAPPSADYLLSATVRQAASTDARVGLVLRGVDASNYYIALLDNPAGGSLTIQKVAGGAGTSLASKAVTLTANTDYPMTFSCVGGVLTAALNGVTVTAFDVAFTTAGRVGLRGNTNARFDDLTAYWIRPVNGGLPQFVVTSLGAPTAARRRPTTPLSATVATALDPAGAAVRRLTAIADLPIALSSPPPSAAARRPAAAQSLLAVGQLDRTSGRASRGVAPLGVAVGADVGLATANSRRRAGPASLTSSTAIASVVVLARRAVLIAELLAATALTPPLATRIRKRTMIAQAQAALVACLTSAAITPSFIVSSDEGLAFDDVAEALNVVKSAQAPQILGEQMGLGEENVLVDFVQVFNLEWVVRGGDKLDRENRFEEGLIAIGDALMADQTLGGACRGLTIAPPDFTTHNLATAPETRAVLIPVRVVLQGRSIIAAA